MLVSVSFKNTLQGFIQDFELEGEKQDGSRVIVACKSMFTHAYACMSARGSGGFEFRSSQMASDTIWDKITILNFKICSWEGKIPGPPTLYMKPSLIS